MGTIYLFLILLCLTQFVAAQCLPQDVLPQKIISISNNLPLTTQLPCNALPAKGLRITNVKIVKEVPYGTIAVSNGLPIATSVQLSNILPAANNIKGLANSLTPVNCQSGLGSNLQVAMKVPVGNGLSAATKLPEDCQNELVNSLPALNNLVAKLSFITELLNRLRAYNAQNYQVPRSVNYKNNFANMPVANLQNINVPFLNNRIPVAGNYYPLKRQNLLLANNGFQINGLPIANNYPIENRRSILNTIPIAGSEALSLQQPVNNYQRKRVTVTANFPIYNQNSYARNMPVANTLRLTNLPSNRLAINTVPITKVPLNALAGGLPYNYLAGFSQQLPRQLAPPARFVNSMRSLPVPVTSIADIARLPKLNGLPVLGVKETVYKVNPYNVNTLTGSVLL